MNDETTSYAVQDEHGNGNALRFSTPERAQLYADDLALRWTACPDMHVVPSTDPVYEGRAATWLDKVSP
jgi:hypothetical protein